MNFILSIVLSAIAVLILVLIPWVGVGALNLSGFFGVFLPYVALMSSLWDWSTESWSGPVPPARSESPRPQASSGACPGSSTAGSTTPRARWAC